MAPKNRVIIDTDPGTDDVIALLIALSASASELETLMLSVTFGNVSVEACTRNVVALFQILEKEIQWRQQQGLPIGFEGVTKYKPIVAMGASEPLHDKDDNADNFHGVDGLAGIHESHPHFSPALEWATIFEKSPSQSVISEAAKQEVDLDKPNRLFTPSYEPSPMEILRLLRENEPDTITLISLVL